jgi:hypothetical protein
MKAERMVRSVKRREGEERGSMLEFFTDDVLSYSPGSSKNHFRRN